MLAAAAMLLAATSAAAAAAGAGTSGIFDAPLAVERVPIGAGENGSARKRQLSCFVYKGLRVKELDLGEVGAAELAILPLPPGARHVPCERQTAPGEIIVPADAWSGYFKGVKSGFVLFDAEDGTNGGLGFAVFDGRSGKKLFEDLAVGEMRAAEAAGAAIRLRYRRAFVAACSIPHQGATCWAAAARMAGVKAAPAPDCEAGYLKAKAAMARGRCEAGPGVSPACLEAEMRRLDEQRWNEAPSVVAYEVEAEIGPSRQSVRTLGGPLSCWPAD